MRPLRFLLTLTSFVVAFFLLLLVGPWRSSTATDVQDLAGAGGSSFGTYFNWHTPSSLFPPSAIISLTDDNSTNFVARPANFGPLLPARSLSGQLWIGSGFGNDHLGRGGSGAGAGGELGCSDVPGWDDGSWLNGKKGDVLPEGQGTKAANIKRSMAGDDDDDLLGKEYPSEDDGTDDHLHHPLPASDGLKTNGGDSAGHTRKPTHADIQSLQESAEIAGKVVLLSRGGCGFLEKVKWAQRRGGIAVIVGDDIRGSQLVTMYARGDTSNVTIPSLFTSYTTAQLLSSLMPGEGASAYIEETNGVAPAGKEKEQTVGQNDGAADKPNFTTATSSTTATATPNPKAEKKPWKPTEHPKKEKLRVGWFAALFGAGSDGHSESRRPPSSGNMGWVLQQEFEDDHLSHGKIGKVATTSVSSSQVATTTPQPASHDGFVIGVQDWRDPDLVAEAKEQQLRGAHTVSTSSAIPRTSKPATTSLRGGSITPGSGEYGKAHHEAIDIGSAKKRPSNDGLTSQHTDQQGDDGTSSRGWLGRLFSSDPGQEDAKHDTGTHKGHPSQAELESHHAKPQSLHRTPPAMEGVPGHEGLWVTLTQTSMSSSPFFDTLLVLVVSPLVTLTVVYALLLMRSRIRRRRWRAPKSVVARLPVRTYQTMPSSTASTTSSVSTPSATTPLLPATRAITTKARPRARTVSEVPQGTSLRSDDMASPSLEQMEEKRAAGLAEWRRRYGGKQRECVVCLEEYVDGVSRVMRLPCGHEFHAECITPWLTTRRRTCPICKGDVVRSLTRSAASSSTPPHHHLPYRDHDVEEEDEEEDVQEQAANIVNDDPRAQQPVSREDEALEDLERGLSPDRNR